MTEQSADFRRENEGELLRLLAENVRDYAIFVMDTQGRVLGWNPGAEALLGYTEEEVIGRSAEIFFTPEDIRDGVPQRELEEARAAGRANDDRWHVRKDGSRFWAGGSMTPLWDKDRRLRGFAKIMRDRTELKRASEELVRRTRESEQLRRLYEAALSNIPDLVYVFGLDHRFTYANQVLLTMWGRTWEEAIGKNCLELGYEPWHAAMHDREIDQVVATKQPIKGEVPFAGTFGRRIYEYIFVPVIGDNGEVEAVAGTTRDVTDRRQSEEALRESEGRFRGLMEQAPFSVQVFSPDGKTLRVNRAWERLWGLTSEDMADYNILQDKTLEAKGILPLLRRAFAGEVVHLPDVRLDPNEHIPGRSVNEDSVRDVAVIAYPFKDDSGGVREVVLVHEDITARQRAEERRRQSDQRTRIVLESISDAFFALDSQWRFSYVNPQAEQLLDREPGDLPGKIIWDVFPGLAGSVFEKAYRQAAAEQTTLSLTAFYPDHNRWYEVHVYPATDGISIYFRDVTERKKAEQEVERLTQASEQQRRMYGTVLSNTPDFNYVFDLRGRFVFVNEALLKLLGKEQSEVVGRNFFDLDYPRELASRLQRQIREVIETRQSVRDETPYANRNGERLYEYIFVPVLGAAGEVEAVAGSTRDITERKQIEEALRESERLYRAIGESIDYGVWICDQTGRTVYLSESFLCLIGMTLEECSDFGWARALHPDEAKDTVAAWKECVETGGRWDREHRYKGVDGRWHDVLARGVPVRNIRSEITGWVGINLDISRLKQVEDELREVDRRKDEFLATLAHELRNPLAPIRNSLQILKMPGIGAETVTRSREMMERQVHQLVRLVDDLLDVSRVMRGKIDLRRERVELAAIVARAVETVQPLMDVRRHRLELSFPQESLLLDADPVRMAQVVGNLLTNAAKYTESDGRIRLAAERSNDTVVLRVRDNGIGIAPETLPHVFELFVQADHASDRAQGGLGIGLTLVKNLAEMHGGKVEARSEGLGKGSEFVVRLPLVVRDQPEAAGKSNNEQSTNGTSAGHRLLVADDNEDAAVSLAMLLRLQGHEVMVAHDGPGALSLTESFRPEMVFLDLGMPGMDGFEVARRLRRQPGTDGVVLVALTGWGQPEDRRRTAEAGFDHHLVKPPEPKALESLLTELSRREVRPPEP